jgi:glutathione S-transferase
VKLYDMTLAPNPRRVRIFLAEKGIEVPLETVDIAAAENLSDAYRSVNPRGVLPTLVLDNGTTIDESMAICRYFEVLQPEPALFGRTAIEQATIESWQRQCEFDGMFAVASIFRNRSKLYVGRSVPGTAPALPQIPEVAARGEILVGHFLDRLEARLAQSPFVGGEAYSVADITALVTIDFARWVRIRIPASHAATLAWYSLVSTRPSAAA